MKSRKDYSPVDEVFLLQLELEDVRAMVSFYKRGEIMWRIVATIGYVLLLTYPAWGCKP